MAGQAVDLWHRPCIVPHVAISFAYDAVSH